MPFVPIRAVKFSLSLLTLAAAVLTLSGCNTLANRRALYSPAEGSGHWSKQYAVYHENHEGIFGVSHDEGNTRIREDEGIFGVSNSDNRLHPGRGPEEGIFGISRNTDDYE